ncbi:hypothetical protein [Nakamurella endophytica]|uniref:Uncharacterized protein n=1 Tax=Nakamurella endophytica TaxID=1748367 RepID=A0A917T0B1_9ACTN|nr:hypothetical protein [Nakamurella endophytica]GGM04461.1 hypothetical protein GCM10011594_25830 [Nakamurella endophytica]
MPEVRRRPFAGSTTASTTTARSTTASTTTATVPPDLPPYRWRATGIDAALAGRMRTSWHTGCPVPLDELRYLRLSYVGFDGRAHQGELVVDRAVVDDVVTAFGRLYRQGFPIRSLRLVDDFGGSDDASMAADNTSAFNCRRTTSGAR